MQAKIEHTLGWAARHRMPVEVVRLEDVQPPSEQLVLVRRLAAKYDLPLAHARADAGGASDAAVSSSSSSSRGALVPQPLRLWSWSHHAAQQRQATRSRRDLDERAPAAALRNSTTTNTGGSTLASAVDGDDAGGLHAVLRDARSWWKFDFDLAMHRAGCACSLACSVWAGGARERQWRNPQSGMGTLGVHRALTMACDSPTLRRSVYLHPEIMDGNPVSPEFSTQLRHKVAAVSPLVDPEFEARLGYGTLHVPAYPVRALD